MIDLESCSDYALLSTAEVAEALGISAGAVRKAAKEGRLRAIGGFRVLYFPAIAVRAFARGETGTASVSKDAQRTSANADATDETEIDGQLR
ncbi:helix-turn-helix domain-containing protein [Bradyrhizobium cytisi]|uniref:Helix-turn-helix domain-containing protein n=1 Tax=Bradyrhizobium cytisi TaxID=515489 RepID=A0A5S4WJE5_9BRAD|nr:helix-turn-helix domain-containing protein [Bradyrhizobium cytisi]TYL81648.1 helix-turn-helix domain-containing protein [Bradyrhizobium cytisi]